MQVFVHDLREDVKPAGGGVVPEQYGEAPAHNEDVADHVQLLTAGYRGVVRENELERGHKGREQQAGVYRVEREAPAEDQEPHGDEDGVYDERYERDGQVDDAVYNYRRARDAAHRRPAGHEEEKHRRGDHGHRAGQHRRFAREAPEIKLHPRLPHSPRCRMRSTMPSSTSTHLSMPSAVMCS